MDELSIEEKFQNTIKGASLDVYRGVVKRKHIQRDWEDKKDFYEKNQYNSEAFMRLYFQISIYLKNYMV